MDGRFVTAVWRFLRRHGVITAGGDTTHGKVETISITLLGRVSPENLCLRSHAMPGDCIAVTGSWVLPRQP
jgi:thiamine-monophosphate kinase